MKVTFKPKSPAKLLLSDLKIGDIFMFAKPHMGKGIYQKTEDNLIVRILNDTHKLSIREEKVALCLTEPVTEYEIEEIVLNPA